MKQKIMFGVMMAVTCLLPAYADNTGKNKKNEFLSLIEVAVLGKSTKEIDKYQGIRITKSEKGTQYSLLKGDRLVFHAKSRG